MKESPTDHNDVRLDREEYESAVQCLRQAETAIYLFNMAGGTRGAESAAHAENLLAILESLNRTALSCLDLPPQH